MSIFITSTRNKNSNHLLSDMIVMKFGGTSVANAEAIKRTIEIVRSRLDKKPIVVVSALAKVTDALYSISNAAENCNLGDASDIIEKLRQRHFDLVYELLGDTASHKEALDKLKVEFDELQKLVKAVTVLGELTPRIKARIISKGELLSSIIIGHALEASGISTRWLDARRFVITNDDYLQADPLIPEIERRTPAEIDKAFSSGCNAVITQGFVATTPEGESTVLGRGGSDYSASLIGMAVSASAIEIWTDVDGVKSADPRRVANTRSLSRISFEEAAEMAHFGAKVLHPLTIEPAVMKNIPVYVLNSLNPENGGTEIVNHDAVEDGVKSISFKEGIVLMNIFSPRMINISGFLMKVFDIFAKNKVSVDLISTSEANISLTINDSKSLDAVCAALSEIAEVRVFNDKSQLSIIGKNVVKQRSLINWAVSSLKGTNVYMISQAASSDNISFVIDRNRLDEVLQEFHTYLFEYK